MIKDDFKILMVYPNLPMEPLMPLSIASLFAKLKQHNFHVKLFDTSFYSDRNTNNDQEHRVYSQQILWADYGTVGIYPIQRNVYDDFKQLVLNYKPSLICVSCVENTYSLANALLETISNINIPVMVGGVFATFSPQRIMENELIDFVCEGEGEHTIIEVAENIKNNKTIEDIPNLWRKNNDKIIPPVSYRIEDVRKLPVPQFDIFEPKRIYRAMSGKVYKMLPIEFSRGCPYQCTYCSAPSFGKKFKESGKWLRFKPIEQIIREIEYYCESYDVDYFYFVSETFLALPQKDREKFYKEYSKINIPFWFNTRPETITKEDIKSLQEINCHRISIGIESGSEDFRRKRLKRNYSNEQVLFAVNTVIDSEIELSVNNMIGFPDETRDLIFETINLNRKFNADSHSISVFQPYVGTELYSYCLKNNYWDSDKVCDNPFSQSVLTMPSISKEEINGLYRTFNLYRQLDRSLWPEIKKAEKLTKEGDKILNNLFKELNNK